MMCANGCLQHAMLQASVSGHIPDAAVSSPLSAQHGSVPAVETACAEAIAHGVHSADVVLNILARQRDPGPPATIDGAPPFGVSAHRGADSEAGVRGLELRCAERKFISRGLSHTWIYSERSPCRR